MSLSLENTPIQKNGVAQTWLEALPCAAFIINPDGRIAAANGQAELILGWPAPELEGLAAEELLDSADKRTTPGAVHEPLHDNAVPERGQTLLRCADDALRPIEYSCIPFPMERGLGAIFGFRELTRELEIEKDLRRLAAIADESPIPIVELNQDANLMYANPAMMALIERFGFSTEVRPVVLPANILKLTRQCLEARSETGVIEVSVAGHHYEWKLFPVSGSDLVRAYGMDVTSRKHALIELTLAKARTEVTSQAKSKVLSNVRGEIHAPLEEITGAAAALLASSLAPEQLEAVRTIKKSCAALITSLKEIGTFAEVDNERLASAPEPFNIRSFVARVMAPFVRRASEKGVQLTVTVSNHVPINVGCDGFRLEQLLRAILRTAIEDRDGGEITFEVDRDSIASAANSDRSDESFRLFINIGYSGGAVSSNRVKSAAAGEADITVGEFRMDGPALDLRCRQLAALLGGTVSIEKDLAGGGSLCLSLPVRQSKPAVTRFGGGRDKLASI
ncbi:MAG TPA: PAS domain-containing protein [Candidatus Binatia bacterium]